MPQSMLAFLAMAMAIMLALSQYRSDIHAYDKVIEDEYELMANALAVEQIEIISASTDWDSLEVWDDSVMTKAFSLTGFQESFEIGVSVQFVTAYGYPSAAPTSIKEVEVSAVHERYALPLVTHARLISE